MREPYGEAVAPRAGPESWRFVCKNVPQALVGVRAGWVLSRESFLSPGRRGRSLGPNAAPGVDGQTWRQYGEDLEANLQDLSGRLKRGAYRARPVKRAWIPKADGRRRPIGIPTLEDKIVQRAAASVLGAVYESDFLGFSYGFR